MKWGMRGCASPHHARLVAAGTPMLTCMFQGKVVMAELDSLNQIASRVANNEENEEALRLQLVSTIIVTTVQHKPWRFVIFTLQ